MIKVLSLLFIIDNTLTKPFENILHEKFKDSFALLKKNFDCIIVSNSAGYYSHDPTGDLASKVEKSLGIPVLLHHYRKPRGGLELLSRIKYKPNQIAVVGDRLFTDVLYANFRGMRSILVHDIITEDGDDYWAIKVIY